MWTQSSFVLSQSARLIDRETERQRDRQKGFAIPCAALHDRWQTRKGYFAVKNRLVAVIKRDGKQFSTSLDERLLKLLITDLTTLWFYWILSCSSSSSSLFAHKTPLKHARW